MHFHFLENSKKNFRLNVLLFNPYLEGWMSWTWLEIEFGFLISHSLLHHPHIRYKRNSLFEWLDLSRHESCSVVEVPNAIAAEVCLGQDRLTKPISLQVGFEFKVFRLVATAKQESSTTYPIFGCWERREGSLSFVRVNITIPARIRPQITDFSFRDANHYNISNPSGSVWSSKC